MNKPVIRFIVPKCRCFPTEPVYFGKALYSPVSGALAVAAITPEEEWEIRFTDENVEPIDFDARCDVAAISIMTVYASRGYEIADEFRRRGSLVIMGGVHATYLPYEVLAHADSVVVGEAEPVWDEVLRDLCDGNLKPVYKADSWFDMRGLKSPPRGLLKEDKYIVSNFVQSARGCPHDCTFCCERGTNGSTYRFRPIDEVIHEIRSMPSSDVCFCDVDIFSQPGRAYELMKAMVPLGKRWQAGASSRVAENDALLDMARRSGCYMLNVGFESLSDNSLAYANKSFNRPERYRDLVDKIHSYGIMVFALAMFGFDSDDESVFERTAKFWIRAGVDGCGFSIVTPYPGTRLFHQLNSEGRILSCDWSKYDQSNVVFEPKLMSSETLREGFGYAYEAFYSWNSILRRFPILGKRNRFYWAITNAYMRAFERKGSHSNEIAHDGTSCPVHYFAEHVRPEASGAPH